MPTTLPASGSLAGVGDALADDGSLAGELLSGGSEAGTVLAGPDPAALGAASLGPDTAHPPHAMATTARAAAAMRRFTCTM